MRPFLQLIRFVLVCISLSFFADRAFAQTPLNIKNFAIFGGDINASLSDSNVSGVQLASNIGITGGGSIGSESFLIFKNHVSVDGDVYGSTAFIGTSFALRGGSMFVFNRQGYFGESDVLSVGAIPQFSNPGNITVLGNTTISSDGTVDGVVTYEDGTFYSGPEPGSGSSITVPVFPAMPVLPDTIGIPAPGSNVITNSQTVKPGADGFMALTGSQTLTFSGVGNYYFNNIADTGANTFVFDFKNNATGVIKIYVQNNVNLGNINVSIINGGSASRIYTEVHGTGSAGNTFTSFAMNTIGATSASWAGTVFAQNGAIVVGNNLVGSVNVINGCMWSSTKVAIGINTAFHYVPLSSSADPTLTSKILPYYPPPADGKVNTLIGSELTSLFEHSGSFNKDSIIYQVRGDSVYIEAIAIQGHYNSALTFLVNNGLTDTVRNGPAGRIITGKFPIANLLKLNADAADIDYVRPLYHPINNIINVNNTGLVISSGDTAMQSNIVKASYGLSGQGVKVGVISDSYNTKEISPGVPGNFAGIDVSNGDLPGTGNPYGYTTPVQIVGEYPLGPHIDEGRAMLQIVHDVAPKAQLAFRTGFVSAGDFAQGIGELGAAGCNIIVDDVTYITEPYFKDGVVAQAVDNVVANGTTYFSAAGNFGKQSYEGTFHDIAAPAAISALASEPAGTRVHDFGAGNPYQTLNLLPGVYTIVLQWEDNIYSLGNPTAGTQTDLDLFLVDTHGSTLFGFNRNNIGTDPLEVLPFTVEDTTTASLVVARATGPNVRFKLIVFRGNLSFDGYNGSATLVGQANSSGAIAVGAVLYKNTIPYGKAVPTIASFSSDGGAEVNSIRRNKPELTAPNGINTTVNFGSFDYEDDGFPNFYGTSAAAPHAAAAAALLIEGRKKFLNETITPANLRTLLQTTAIDMSTPGYDTASGYGFVNPFGAMETFASPVPIIDSLVTPAPLTQPVTAPFTVTVKGKGLNSKTVVYFGPTALTTAYIDNQTVTAEIPAFTANPPVRLFNPSIIIPALTANVDGGFSDSAYFFSHGKKHIVVKANDTTKLYGERLPAFTATITVDGVPIQNTGLTLAGLKLDHLTYATPASVSSNVASYFIHPVDPLNPALPADAALLAKYSYEFANGVLTVKKLPLKITPRDTTLVYGQQIHGIKYKYNLGPSDKLQNPDSLLSALNLSYGGSVLDSLFALINTKGATSRALVNGDFDNLSILVSGGSGATSRALVNNGSGPAQTSYIVDINPASIINYENNNASSPLVNGGSGATSRALVNTGPLINGTASIIVNGGSGATSRALVNGDPSLINSNTTGGTSNTNVAVIVSAEDVPTAANNSITTRPINLITGITEGIQTIVPGAFLSENFEITYGLGKLTINRAPLVIKANSVSTDNGVLPSFTSTITGYQYQDADATPKTGPVYTVTPSYTGQPGIYQIKPSGFSFPGDSNYVKTYTNGALTVKPFIHGVVSFTLVDANTDKDIRPISNGDIIDVYSLPTTKLNIRANLNPVKQEACYLSLMEKMYGWKMAPLSLSAETTRKEIIIHGICL